MAFKLFDRIQETSTTTGTGDFSLTGAVTGFKTFGSRYSTGDTLYYAIHEVDVGGAPSGAWEIGLGTYSAANTLTRTTVISSSASDAAINFAAGDKRVFVTMTSAQGASIREKLTAARTYYVRTDGSDSNNGLANTSGGAFLTIQKAVDVVSYTLDFAGYAVTIQVGDGTYTSGISMRPMTGGSALTIQGNSTTPSNVVISTTSANAASNGVGGISLVLKDMKLTTTTSGSCISCSSGGYVTVSGINFGSCANNHISCQQFGRVSLSGNYAISGGAQSHYFFSGYGYISGGSKTVTITGTPAFSVAFAYANTPAGLENYSFTWSGSATGKRYDISANAVIFTGGGGVNYFPGSVDGTNPSGAQYL